MRNERARFHEIFKKLFDVLIVDVELILESVQFGILVDRPPLAVKHGVLRIGGLPFAGIFKLGGRFLVGGGRRLNGGRGRVIFGPDDAARQGKCRDRGAQQNYLSNIIHSSQFPRSRFGGWSRRIRCTECVSFLPENAKA